ncbi:cytochrome P450 [Irpex rosettiformis]|uniref:Cytochrome P450 n=1 Tax=Irpex rosettiformis TaxID=378272 RepID=A0ACB8U2P3_9APHY|nr:cytochrome P450 [Irpex rosettiformis]
MQSILNLTDVSNRLRMNMSAAISKNPGVNADARLPIPAVIFLIIVMYTVYSRFRQRHAAPGPPRLPFVGNVFQQSKTLQFLQYTEWSKKYGPVFSLDLLGQHVVVLNTYKAATDLFDRHSSIYNDRPRMIMANEILGDGIFLPLVRYGDVWRRLRRAAHESFSVKAVQNFRPIQREAAHLASLSIHKDPGSWTPTVEWFAASSIFSSVYNWPPLEAHSPVIKQMRDFMARFTDAAMPGTFLVDFFPFMRIFPSWMARWKREGLAWNQAQSELFGGSKNGVLEKMDAGESPAGFTADLISAGDKFGLTKKELTWLPGIMVTGAIETTSAAIENCMLAMLHDPAIMYKAQAELDAVVGRERAPTFEDRDNLPYIRAIVRETLRWRPIAPLALPHYATEDHWYSGYFISKGTFVIGNVWAMNRDPLVHADPDAFRPERYLDASGKEDFIPAGSHHLGHITFGFGRRICSGINFAEQGLFIGIATLLWAFDVKPVVDEKGKAMLPSLDDWHDNGAVVRPTPFKCQFPLRFPEVQTILEASVSSKAV